MRQLSRVQLTDRIAYRNLVNRVFSDLLCVHYYITSDGLMKVLEPLTKKQIAVAIGSTSVAVSRAYGGVTSLNAECFYLLCKLHDSRLDGICEKIFNI